MAGKRPDQHNIDPREAGATDYKTLPQSGHGKSAQDETTDADKHAMAQQAASANIPFNPAHPAPSVHARAGRPVGQDGEVAEEGKEREARGNTDPRDEGVGA